MDINSLLSSFQRSDYQRDNFDAFLKKVRFSFSLPAIHIAGTNGKGSTASYLAAIYQQNGYKVGRFTSPYLFEVNEMIVVNGTPISDDDFLNIFNEYEKLFRKYDLSAFEIETLIAFNYFMKEACDICVIECGMGGEIDATNIFVPILSIITSISLEHTDFLGHTISEIAEQKCGIIKDKIPLLIDEFDQDAVATIYKEAKNKQTPIHFIKKHIETSFDKKGISFQYHPFGLVHLNSFAPYACQDACFALEATLLLRDQFPIKVEETVNALGNVFMECRFEIIDNVILDGGHNTEAAKEVVSAINQYTNKPIHVIFACFKDKNLGSLLSYYGSLGDDLTLTTFHHPRARTQDEYFLFLGDYQFVENPIQLLKDKMEEYPDDIILITGSIAFVAYMKKEALKNV